MSEARHILPQNVKFEINDRTFFYIVEVGVLIGIRNDADLKSIVRRAANGQTNAIDRDTAFLYGKIALQSLRAIRLVGKGENITAIDVLHLLANSCRVYVSLHDVSVQTAVHQHRAFYVHFIAWLQQA